MGLSLFPFFFHGSSKPQMMQEEVSLDLAVSGRGPSRLACLLRLGPWQPGSRLGVRKGLPCSESPRDRFYWWGL